jgi:hypothetical protein
MPGKFQLFTLIESFLLYFLDLGTDVYVAIQHKQNGDREYFNLTAGFIISSIIVVNIFATYALKAPWYLRALAFLTHFSMIYLFIGEIWRWWKESSGDEARPCDSGKHFSECGCSKCQPQLKKSVKASLNMSHVRSMETFIEAIPQWLLQVNIMVYEQSFPWLTIVSVAVSFISLVFGIYSLEKNYWIWKIVERGQNYIKPVSFPKSSTVVFLIWQSFLLLGRLSAIILHLFVFRADSIVIYIGTHWSIVVLGLVYSVGKTCDKNGDCYTCVRYLTISFLSLFLIYPLLFHVSHSSVACMKKFLPDKNLIEIPIEAFAVTLIPLLFMIFHCVSGVFAIKHNGKDELLVWYIVVGSLYVLALFFEAIFYFRYHPLKVTYKNWQELKDRGDVLDEAQMNN